MISGGNLTGICFFFFLFRIIYANLDMREETKMNLLTNKFTDPIFLSDLAISVLILGIISFFLIVFLRRKFVVFSILIADAVYVLARIFDLTGVSVLAVAFLFASGIVYVTINASEYRYYILNNVKSRNKRHAEKRMVKESFYKMISDTVKELSRTKTGAIITFEKTTNLNDIVKNGTMINAPVCSELLMTIFYPGTRLHDGAVVIRGDKILAASVYYTPTTRALSGKYGSRHRAAFGISEISDAVTVVVSEETGRISLTYKGQMESCSYDSFLEEFIARMDDDNNL